MDDAMLDRLCDELIDRLAAEGWHPSRAAVRGRIEILRGLCLYNGRVISLDQIDCDTGKVVSRPTN